MKSFLRLPRTVGPVRASAIAALPRRTAATALIRHVSTTSPSRAPSLATQSQSSSPSSSLPPQTHHESPWKTTDIMSLTRETFLDMLDGKTPILRQPSFVPRDVAQKLEDELSPKLSPYSFFTGPPLKKIGVAQFEFQAQAEDDLQKRSNNEKERYFREVEKVESLHSDLAAIAGENVQERIMAKIASLVPEWDVMVANEGPGKRYFSGIFRAINESTPIHCDWSPYDSRTEDWVINRITKQAVFNLYLAPMKGGKTVIYDLQWTPSALQYRDPASYGYWPDLVEGRQKQEVHPQPGDLCLFNSRNMHQVFPVEAEPHPVHGKDWRRPRLTLSSFMGYLPPQKIGERPKLMFWS